MKKMQKIKVHGCACQHCDGSPLGKRTMILVRFPIGEWRAILYNEMFRFDVYHQTYYIVLNFVIEVFITYLLHF